jgi:DNA-binding MarR family transcriptional regulator
MAVFAALLRSFQLLKNQVDHVMRSHDLTFARYEVLAWLATDPESSLTLSWISNTLRIPPATLTNIIDRLEADRLVKRVPHPTDARTTLAVITPLGRRAATSATEDLNSTVYEPLDLSERDRRRLVEILADLRGKGHEFDVAHSQEMVDELGSRQARRQGSEGQARSA